MNLRLFALIATAIFCTHCSDEPDIVPIEPVIRAYDTLELRYQQMGDLAMELISNVSVDPQIRTNKVPDLLERQPVVSLDFRKPVTTRKDILSFVNYQKKIDGGIQQIFVQLGETPKWRSAPLILEFRSQYDSIKKNIAIATTHFNSVVKETKLNLAIPADSVATKTSN
ncbi:hypothetical protein [Flavitalea sp.]|nr:hypothetical protein [Flavitalea sp.]